MGRIRGQNGQDSCWRRWALVNGLDRGSGGQDASPTSIRYPDLLPCELQSFRVLFTQ